MALALTEAYKGYGLTSPNPMVGAVIVKNGQVVATGYHTRAGKPHAEIEALKKAGTKAKGATMYVTLEPCCHWGRTPPCTRVLVKAGIRKVVAAMQDPNPVVKGKGTRFLRQNGIRVRTGLMGRQARELNEIYCRQFSHSRPFVTMKIAQTLDGRIADISGNSKWITNGESRKAVHKLRSMHDAVMAGVNTVIKDNPRLTARIPGGRNPYRIILDSTLRTPLTSAVTKNRDRRTIVVAGTKAPTKRVQRFMAKGITVWQVKRGTTGLDLKAVLKKARAEGISSILVEGGQRVFSQVLKHKLADKLVVFIAPKVLGKGKAGIEDCGINRISLAWQLQDVVIKEYGSDFSIEGRLI